jgi:hypothetical protein
LAEAPPELCPGLKVCNFQFMQRGLERPLILSPDPLILADFKESDFSFQAKQIPNK